VICFNRGIIAQGTPGVVFNPAILRQTYDADMVVIRHGEMTFIASRSLIHRHAGESAQGRRSTADGTTG
jgi:zinc/manganese transport system ATP-binding protein/zinc transport system ATP-binding protein